MPVASHHFMTTPSNLGRKDYKQWGNKAQSLRKSSLNLTKYHMPQFGNLLSNSCCNNHPGNAKTFHILTQRNHLISHICNLASWPASRPALYFNQHFHFSPPCLRITTPTHHSQTTIPNPPSPTHHPQLTILNSSSSTHHPQLNILNSPSSTHHLQLIIFNSPYSSLSSNICRQITIFKSSSSNSFFPLQKDKNTIFYSNIWPQLTILNSSFSNALL